MHTDDVERVREIIRRRQAGKPAPEVYECRIIRPDGNIIHLEISSSLISYRGRPAALSYLRDISERKLLNGNLKIAKKRWENIFQAIGEPAVIIDSQNIILAANQAIINVSGLPLDDILGRKCYEVFHGRDSTTHADGCPFVKLILSGKMESAEMEVSLFGGIYNISCIPIFDNDGHLEQIIHIAADITKKKRTEEALRQSESLLKSIFLAAPIGIGLVVDRIIKQVNDRVCEMTGFSRAELLEQNAKIFYPTDEDFEYVGREKYRQIKAYGTGSVETRWRRKDGAIINVLLSSTPLDPENLAGEVTFTVLDITQRKQIENSLRENEEKYRLLADNSIDAIWTMDLKGNFTYVSPSVYKLLGFTPNEVIGVPLEKTVFKEDLAQVMKDLYTELNKPRTERSEQRILYLRMYKKDKSLLDVEVSVSWLYDRKDELIGLQGSTRDIAERKKIENSRSMLEAQLFNLQKMESIGALASGIAHDFNNILMGIQGYVSLMQLDLHPEHPHREKLRRIEDQIRSGANLTAQLLMFARGGKFEVKPTSLNLLLDKSSEIFSRTKKEITINKKFQNDLLMADVDTGQIEQVLLNLYINAWQAMPEGGDLTLSTKNVVLDEAETKPYGTRPGKYVQISVTDTGVGMDQKTQKRIFEPFFTTKKLDKGTGLGLAIAYGIIRNHDGYISVTSEHGKGSTFQIYLPASGQESKTDTEIAVKESIMTGKETILLVDDEQNIIFPIKILLEELGYKVMVSGSGQEAIALYLEKGKSIDLVILDMIMPGIGGGKTFDALVAVDPAVKVILASGYSEDGDAHRIMERGCRGFIQKPFRITDLSKMIRGVLDSPAEK